MNLKLIASLILSHFALAAGPKGGGTVVTPKAAAAKVDALMADLPEDEEEEDDDDGEEDDAKEVNPVLVKLQQQGADEAAKMIKGQTGVFKSRLDLCLSLAGYDERAHAANFVKGFRDTCDTLAESKDGSEAAAATSTRVYAAQLTRCVVAIFGKRVKDKNTGSMVEVPGIGREEFVKIMRKPKLTLGEKLKKLPKATTAGRGTNDSKGIQPIQIRRLATAEGAGPMGDFNALAAALNVPTKMGDKTLSEAERQTFAERALRANIKASPDSMIGAVVEATIARLLISSNADWQRLGSEFRKVWNAHASEQGTTLPAATGSTTKATKPQRESTKA
jgi:hypothetical protein